MSSQFNGGDDDITEKGKSKSSVLKLNITMQHLVNRVTVVCVVIVVIACSLDDSNDMDDSSPKMIRHHRSKFQ